MATSQVSTQSSYERTTNVTPSVVPFPLPAVEQITQFELAACCSLRNRARQLAEQVETAEKSVRERLESGAQVEAGEHTATLKESSRRSVAWKDVAIRLADRLKLDGEMYCARVLAATKPSKTVSLEIS